jgi:hypothetical protein
MVTPIDQQAKLYTWRTFAFMHDREALISNFQMLERVNRCLLSWNFNLLTKFPDFADCLAPKLALSSLFDPCLIALNRKEDLRPVNGEGRCDLVPNPLFKLPTTDQLERLFYTTIYAKVSSLSAVTTRMHL